ncbi:MAG: RsmB/NOP family class I SAM-dependent RNA methyltransferase [Kiritimatiellia bacterium]
MSARRDAIFALSLWKTQGTFPAAALEGSTEHAFALDLVGTALRHKSSLEWMLKRCVKRLPDGELWGALLVGAAQLLYMPNVAEYAAIDETVEAVKAVGKGATAFINAALRRLQRERPALLAELALQPPHLRLDIPRQLWERWVAALGMERVLTLAETLAHPRATYLTPLDGGASRILAHGAALTEDADFIAGRCLVQDPAQQQAVALLDVRPGLRILDACAAPGGKTVQIAARMQGQGSLLATEWSEARLPRLNDTIARCNFSAFVHVQHADVTKACLGSFDRILLDAPCSNTGVFGRRPDARWTWTKKKLADCVQTQRALLDACAAMLAPNGRLVYSTCSIEPEEDAEQVAAFLERQRHFKLEKTAFHLPDAEGDGAFAAALIATPSV